MSIQGCGFLISMSECLSLSLAIRDYPLKCAHDCAHGGSGRGKMEEEFAEMEEERWEEEFAVVEEKQDFNENVKVYCAEHKIKKGRSWRAKKGKSTEMETQVSK